MELRQVREQGLQDIEGECSRLLDKAGKQEAGWPWTAPSPQTSCPHPPLPVLQVMDEADRLLEQGCTDFTVDLEAILAAVPARRQTLLFSATLTDTLRELQGLATNQPFFWEAQAP